MSRLSAMGFALAVFAGCSGAAYSGSLLSTSEAEYAWTELSSRVNEYQDDGAQLVKIDATWIDRLPARPVENGHTVTPALGLVEEQIVDSYSRAEITEQARCAAEGIARFYGANQRRPAVHATFLIALHCGLREVWDIDFEINDQGYRSGMYFPADPLDDEAFKGEVDLFEVDAWARYLRPAVAGGWLGIIDDRIISVVVGTDPPEPRQVPVIRPTPAGGHGDSTEVRFWVDDPALEFVVSADASDGDWGTVPCEIVSAAAASRVHQVSCPWSAEEEWILATLLVETNAPNGGPVVHEGTSVQFRTEPDPLQLVQDTDTFCGQSGADGDLDAKQFSAAISRGRSTLDRAPVEALPEQSLVDEAMAVALASVHLNYSEVLPLLRAGHLVPWRFHVTETWLPTTVSDNPCAEVLGAVHLNTRWRERFFQYPAGGVSLGSAGNEDGRRYAISYYSRVNDDDRENMESQLRALVNEQRASRGIEPLPELADDAEAYLDQASLAFERGNRARSSILAEIESDLSEVLNARVRAETLFSDSHQMFSLPEWLEDEDAYVMLRATAFHPWFSNRSYPTMLLIAVFDR
jgi:hypothetical protein